MPSPPGVAAQIIDLSQNVGSDIESLAEVVSMDPVLSAKIIRMANSGEVTLDPKLIQCINFSGPIVDCIYCDEEYKNYIDVAEMAEKQFGLDITDFLSLIGKLTKEFQEMAALFDIDVGDPQLLQSNADNAKQILSKSMGVV